MTILPFILFFDAALLALAAGAVSAQPLQQGTASPSPITSAPELPLSRRAELLLTEPTVAASAAAGAQAASLTRRQPDAGGVLAPPADPRRNAASTLSFGNEGSARSSVDTFTVTNTLDSGAGSFRKALDTANATPGKHLVRFNIPGSGVRTIMPTRPLPVIIDSVIIDGTTQPGYSSIPLIEINGFFAGLTDGLVIQSGKSVIRALTINRFGGSGISLSQGGENVVAGCFIGTDASGNAPAGNGRSGILIAASSSNNRIGDSLSRPNVISANAEDGISIIGSPGNRIVNSYIGLADSGTASLQNGFGGIYLLNSQRDTIGGTSRRERNVISGNHYSGIDIEGALSYLILIEGNYIGTDPRGKMAVGNHENGILIMPDLSSPSGGTPYIITIGGPASQGAGNLISGNYESAVVLLADTIGGGGTFITGNVMGLDSAQTARLPNGYGAIYAKRFQPFDLASLPAPPSLPFLVIGGGSEDSANVIAGNKQNGIWIRGSGARRTGIRGNYIGTSGKKPSGILPFGNEGWGIYIDNAPQNAVGSFDPLSGNVIGSNGQEGVAITGDTAIANSLENNFIGTDRTGSLNLGNLRSGVIVTGALTQIGTQYNGNVLGWNHGGVVVAGRWGGNTIRFNAIHDNTGGLGIDLLTPLNDGAMLMGVTPNDGKDIDTGANGLQNFPILDSGLVSPDGSIRIRGRFQSAPGQLFTLDFYKNRTRNGSHFGEGETYVGSMQIRPDTSGWADITLTITGKGVTEDDFITATATDSLGNTSEFSRALCLKDTDGDGILDCWETQGDGIDWNADGIIDLNLWDKGARPNRKDVFVEVDWMRGHEPSPEALQMVADAFWLAPVDNPSGVPGIHLVNEFTTEPADTGIPDVEWHNDPWAEFFAAKKLYFGTDAQRDPMNLNGPNVIEAKRLVYRYCIFADTFKNSQSGVAETWGGQVGNDFIITLGDAYWAGASNELVAGTYMHELGHTLGLQHGGGDALNCKPNYFSVMNYIWQTRQENPSPASALDWKLDFSHFALPTLTEGHPYEAGGIGSPFENGQPAIVPYNGPAGTVQLAVMQNGTAVDFDGNKDSTGFAGGQVDLNDLPANPDPPHIDPLPGYADWPNLKYNFRNSILFKDGRPSPAARPASPAALADAAGPEELDSTVMSRINALPPYGLIQLYKVVRLSPRGPDSTAGGRGISVDLTLDAPAPPGGATFYFESSAPDILPVDSMVTVREGYDSWTLNLWSNTVAADTTVTISLVKSPLHAQVTLRILGAHLKSFALTGGSVCVLGQQTGASNTLVGGHTVQFGLTLDGNAPPPAGATILLSTSDTTTLPVPASVTIGAGNTYADFWTATPVVGSAKPVVVTASYLKVTIQLTVNVIPKLGYTFSDLGQPGDLNGHPVWINNRGDVIVYRTDTTGPGTTWLWQNGQSVRTDVLTGLVMMASSINDAGAIAGQGYYPGQESMGSHAFVWQDGYTRFFPDSLFGYTWSRALLMNNRGDLVGQSYRAAPYQRSSMIWVWTASGIIDSIFMSDSTGIYHDKWWNEYKWVEVRTMNDSGIVLSRADANVIWVESYNVIWDNGSESSTSTWYGTLYKIPNAGNAVGSLGSGGWFMAGGLQTWIMEGLIPGATSCDWAIDINDHGEVAGTQLGIWPSGSFPFVYMNGYQYDLNCNTDLPAGWQLTRASHINNRGQVIGSALSNGTERAFLVTPGGLSLDVKPSGPPAAGAIPASYSLGQNYPNPFNPVTTIRYSLPAASSVRLTVYTVLGQQVAVLLEKEEQPGFHSVVWDGSGVASGIYFYRLEAVSLAGSPRCTYTETRKALLMK